MLDNSESTVENDARMQALLEIGVPEFLRLCRKIRGQLKSIGDDAPSITDSIRLKTIKLPFDTWRNTFVNKDITFINIEQTPFSSISRDDAASRAKANTALCSGNLVSLLALIFDANEGKADATSFLQELDDAFPILFDPSFHDRTDSIEETFDLAFRIRCCRLVNSLAVSSSQQPPLYLAADLFCDKAHIDVDIAAGALEAGPYRQLSNINLNEDSAFHTKFRSRFKQLLSQMSSGSKSKIRATLDETFSKETIMGDLKTWAMERLEQVAVPTAASNGSSTHEGSELLFVDAEEDRQVDSGSDSEAESQAVHIPSFNGPT